MPNAPQQVRQPWPASYIALFAVCASGGLALLYASLGLRVLHDSAHPTTIWQGHAAGVSLATYGKWSASNWPVDGFSGEFPTFYNFVSDYLLNALARLFDLSPTFVQVLLYGPLLSGAMLFLNFIFLTFVFKNRLIPLVASLIISFGTDLPIPDFAYSYFGEGNVAYMKARMHVPFLAMPLATSQCFGWLLFVPVLACVYRLRTERTIAWALASGAGLGILFQAHSLTFINVTTAACLFIYAHSLGAMNPAKNASRRSCATRFFRVGAAPLVFLALAFLAVNRTDGFSLTFFAILWLAFLALSITSWRDILLLVAMGGTALLVSAHYLLHLLTDVESLASFEAVKVGGMMNASSVLLYFLPLWVAAIAAALFMPWRFRASLIWAFCILIATLMLSLGDYWGFGNHPYRMSINLIFPLAILFSAFSFWEAIPLWMRIAWILPLLALGAVALVRNVTSLHGHGSEAAELGSTPRFYSVVKASDEEFAFLDLLRKHLVGGGRVLLPPGPQGMVRNAIMLGFSRIPAFIPDHRFIAWPDLYAQRVQLFCALFPGFPHFAADSRRQYCDGKDGRSIDGSGAMIPLIESLRADVLPIYGIRYFAHWTDNDDLPFAQMAADYGMKTVHATPGKGLFLVEPAEDGRATFEKASYGPAAHINVDATVSRDDCYTFIFSGTQFARLLRTVTFDGAPLRVSRHGNNAVYFSARMHAGTSRITFVVPEDQRLTNTTPTPFVFATGIPAKRLDAYIRFQGIGVEAECQTPRDPAAVAPATP